MSIDVLATVRCDSLSGCFEVLEFEDCERDTAQDYAISMGWVKTVPGWHICPACQAKREGVHHV